MAFTSSTSTLSYYKKRKNSPQKRSSSSNNLKTPVMAEPMSETSDTAAIQKRQGRFCCTTKCCNKTNNVYIRIKNIRIFARNLNFFLNFCIKTKEVIKNLVTAWAESWQRTQHALLPIPLPKSR